MLKTLLPREMKLRNQNSICGLRKAGIKIYGALVYSCFVKFTLHLVERNKMFFMISLIIILISLCNQE